MGASFTYEKFEHPSNDGSHQWTVLAFKDGKDIGGYTGPAFDHPTTCRMYVTVGPIRITKRSPLEVDCGLLVKDLPEQDCRAFIERHAA